MLLGHCIFSLYPFFLLSVKKSDYLDSTSEKSCSCEVIETFVSEAYKVIIQDFLESKGTEARRVEELKRFNFFSLSLINFWKEDFLIGQLISFVTF